MKRLAIFLIPLIAALPAFAQRAAFFGQNVTTSGLSLFPGATLVQESLYFFCAAGTNTCSTTSAPFLNQTTPGATQIIYAITGNSNVTITSVTWSGGGTWNLCPASACHTYNSGNDDIDAAYNSTSTTGETDITVNLSGNAAGYFYLQIVEILPPSGYTASLDTEGTASDAACTSCAGVALTTTSTDAIIQVADLNNQSAGNAWGSWSTTYGSSFPSIDNTSGIYFNVPAGTYTAPTMTVAVSGPTVVSALAFKFSAGAYTSPTNVFSMTHETTFPAGISCSPTCSLTIPSTGSGHLLYLAAASENGDYITAVTCSSCTSWTVPAGANTCQVDITGATSNVLSCAYLLSSTSGTTTLSLTMSGSDSIGFAVAEIARTGGTFALDAQNSASNSASLFPPGVALTLTGTNDVIFQEIFCPGEPWGLNLYPNDQDILNAGANIAGPLMNANNGSAVIWLNPQNNATAVAAVAFK